MKRSNKKPEESLQESFKYKTKVYVRCDRNFWILRDILRHGLNLAAKYIFIFFYDKRKNTLEGIEFLPQTPISLIFATW